MDSMTAPTVGVDPGARFAGIVRLDPAGDLVTARVLDRERLGAAARRPLDRRAWHFEVIAAIFDALAEAHYADAHVSAVTAVLGLEDVVPPNRHAGRARGAPDGIANVAGLLDTARLVGAIEQRWPAVILVRPRGNGSGPDDAYPPGIRKGTRGLGGPPDHARSAYDVAHAARVEARILAAARIPGRPA